jgi:hypothetical protein
MPQPAHIEAHLLKTNKLFLLVLRLAVFMLIGLSLTIYLSSKSKSGVSVVTIMTGILFFFILPLIFISQRIKLFTKTAIIELNNELVKFEILNGKMLTIEEQHEYRYRDIKSYQMGESEKSSYLKLVLNNGKEVKYSFFEQTDNQENVLKNIQTFFASYNEGKSINEKITILPNFYATAAGRYIIIGLAVLIAIAVLLQVVYKPSTIPYSLLTGLILYFRIKAQQKRDIELYEKFK